MRRPGLALLAGSGRRFDPAADDMVRISTMDAARTFTLGQSWSLILKDMGVAPGDVLRRAGMPDDLLARSGVTLTPAEYYRLWEAFEAEADDPELPITIGRTISVEAFEPPIFAALCSHDLDVAVERIARYKPLVGPLEIRVDRNSDGTRIECHWPAGPQPPASMATVEVVFWVALVRLATRSHIRPAAVTAPARLANELAYRRYYGTAVTQGERHSVTFRREDAERPFLTANEPMWEFFEPELRRRLSELEADASTGDRVHAALLEMLPAGEASVEAVAKRLMVSSRTLQRRLRDAGTSYQVVLNETREALARHYLANSSLPAAEISFLLGYDDPNSFYRAFHGWTGETPERVRTAAIR